MNLNKFLQLYQEECGKRYDFQTILKATIKENGRLDYYTLYESLIRFKLISGTTSIPDKFRYGYEDAIEHTKAGNKFTYASINNDSVKSTLNSACFALDIPEKYRLNDYRLLETMIPFMSLLAIVISGLTLSYGFAALGILLFVFSKLYSMGNTYERIAKRIMLDIDRDVERMREELRENIAYNQKIPLESVDGKYDTMSYFELLVEKQKQGD